MPILARRRSLALGAAILAVVVAAGAPWAFGASLSDRLLGLFSGSSSEAAEPAKPVDAKPKASAESASTATGTQPFARQAEAAGATSCSTLLPVLGGMLTRGASYTVQSNWTKDAGDTNPLQSFVGLAYGIEGFDGPAAGYVFVDPRNGRCDGTMVRVVPFPQSCDAVTGLLPKGSGPLTPLSGVKSYALGDGGNALMIPAKNGCTVISIATARSTPPTTQKSQ